MYIYWIQYTSKMSLSERHLLLIIMFSLPQLHSTIPISSCTTDVIDLTKENLEVNLEPDDFLHPKTISALNKCKNLPDNPEQLGNKFEGDMAGIVPPRGEEESKSQFKQYNAINGERHYWPNGVVPYKISSQFGQDARRVIANAINDYSLRTCIKWQPRSGETNYVLIKGNEAGCWSWIGRIGNGKQDLNLGHGCVHKGIIIHEMMHAVGFFHEQSRNDRDEWVRINWGNILQNQDHNFEKHGLDRITHLGTQYDYKSLMHYGAKAFSSNGQKTITTLKAGGENIGQRGGLSDNDVVKLNKLYKCDVTTTAGSCVDESAFCAFIHLAACRSPNGYTGTKSTTVSGKTCQNWNENTPHGHTQHIGDHNHCRNPDGDKSPWCYTTDPRKRWEFCFATCAQCVDKCDNCAHHGERQCQDIRGYQGNKSTTKSGKTCQKWSLDTPHPHAFNDIGDHNFCRNPDNDAAPWCFTTDPDKAWDFCFEKC